MKKKEDKQIYKKKRQQVKRIITQEKRNSWNKKFRKVEIHIGRRCTEVWKFINNIRSDNNRNLQIIPIRQWEEYYKRLLTEQRKKFKEENMPVGVEEIPVKIKVNTIVRAIKKLKNRKASGGRRN